MAFEKRFSAAHKTHSVSVKHQPDKGFHRKKHFLLSETRQFLKIKEGGKNVNLPSSTP
jgi:hypothetical protein